jgi:hypothetical protein
LLRRLNVWKKGSGEVLSYDTVLTSAKLKYAREYKEGITLLKGEIKAGDQGKEASWSLDSVAEVQVGFKSRSSSFASRVLTIVGQYIIRVMLKPPTNFIGSIPCFRLDEVLRVTTDSWGILDRELSSMGGTPTPAIGLAANIRRCN